MKYKIWDERNKRYAEDMTMLPDGSMLRDGGVKMFNRDDKDGNITRDDFRVQWVKDPGDDLVDPRIWEDYKTKEDIKRMAQELVKSFSELRGIIMNAQDKLLAIIGE